jgi:hypothetical protein
MSVDCAHLGQIVVLNPAHSQYKCFSRDDVTQCDIKYLHFPQAMNLFLGLRSWAPVGSKIFLR